MLLFTSDLSLPGSVKTLMDCPLITTSRYIGLVGRFIFSHSMRFTPVEYSAAARASGHAYVACVVLEHFEHLGFLNGSVHFIATCPVSKQLKHTTPVSRLSLFRDAVLLLFDGAEDEPASRGSAVPPA